jgi:chromosome segregation ATPase
MNLLKLFNKRKREIERLNTIIDRLIDRNEQLEKSVRITKAEKDLTERALATANKNIIDLTHEAKYLKMQVDNAKDKVDSRYY